MSEIVLFDYGQLDVETRIVVQQRTSEIKDLLRSALGDMIEAGRKCKEVRDALRHDKSGGFMGWVDKEGLGRQTVYSIMSMHDVFGNYPKFGQLDIGKTAAYLLAAPSTPEPARLEAIERAEAGETITHTVAKQIVAQHRTPPPSHRAEPEPARTLDAALPAIQPTQPPADPLGNDSRIIAMDKLAAEIRERRPAPPVRPLTDNEAEAVVWRGIAHHAKSGMPHHKLAWLQAAEVGDFSRLLNPGVSFEADQLTHIKAKIEAELSKQVPAPVQPVIEPEPAERDGDENYTPPYVIEAVRQVLGGIDLDPASCERAQSSISASVYYTKADDGLSFSWKGAVWVNDSGRICQCQCHKQDAQAAGKTSLQQPSTSLHEKQRATVLPPGVESAFAKEKRAERESDKNPLGENKSTPLPKVDWEYVLGVNKPSPSQMNTLLWTLGSTQDLPPGAENVLVSLLGLSKREDAQILLKERGLLRRNADTVSPNAAGKQNEYEARGITTGAGHENWQNLSCGHLVTGSDVSSTGETPAHTAGAETASSRITSFQSQAPIVREQFPKISFPPAQSAMDQKATKCLGSGAATEESSSEYQNTSHHCCPNCIPVRYPVRAWLNPPYSKPLPFIFKMISEYEKGHVIAAIVLTNNGTDTQWGQELLSRPYPVCFVGATGQWGSRLSFWQTDPDEPRTGNRYAQMIFYLGKEPDKFREVFSQFGVIR